MEDRVKKPTSPDWETAKRLADELTEMVGETIRDLDHGLGAPNGPIYATVMNVISLETYNAILNRLETQGKIRRSAEILRWTGPR